MVHTTCLRVIYTVPATFFLTSIFVSAVSTTISFNSKMFPNPASFIFSKVNPLRFFYFSWKVPYVFYYSFLKKMLNKEDFHIYLFHMCIVQQIFDEYILKKWLIKISWTKSTKLINQCLTHFWSNPKYCIRGLTWSNQCSSIIGSIKFTKSVVKCQNSFYI